MAMTDWLLAHQASLRLCVFVGVFALLAAVQSLYPFRGVGGRTRRWSRHLLLTLLGTLLVRVLFPIAAVSAGATAQAQGYGVLQWLGGPYWLQVLVGVVLLDLAIYLQHQVFHHLPWLWRLHRMHHSDTDFDVSTAIRFHPVEIALSMLIKIGVVLALGIPALAVLLFEILLNATALFSHSDFQLPPALDRRLRWLLVTPDMHRIHHSVERIETNSNYGFCLSCWDRLFGTYRDRALHDPRSMPIGIEQFREAADQQTLALLAQPLR
jgi:sterol desaturase/sphingolipid hydroxylase (fatty acid hydroxylase superfamily)